MADGIGEGLDTPGLGPAKGVDCGTGVVCGDATGARFCAAGVAGACCARAVCAAANATISPNEINKRLHDCRRLTQVKQLRRFITSFAVSVWEFD